MGTHIPLHPPQYDESNAKVGLPNQVYMGENRGDMPTTSQAPTQNVVIVQAAFGKVPQRMTCPYCQKDIVTVTRPVSTSLTHVVALVLCLFGCCCCVPCVYCTDGCLGADHSCPNCERLIGQCNDIM